MYWCALIRIHCAQINQTFHSTILVFIIVVSLHSDAYLRSLTLSHKIGGEQNVLDQYNLAKNVLDQSFSQFARHTKHARKKRSFVFTNNFSVKASEQKTRALNIYTHRERERVY